MPSVWVLSRFGWRSIVVSAADDRRPRSRRPRRRASRPCRRSPSAASSVAPLAQPPAGSAPVVLFLAPCFEEQGGTSLVDAADLHLLHPGEDEPAVAGHLDSVRREHRKDHARRFPASPVAPRTSSTTCRSKSATTGPLKDYVFPNGTIGKIIVYNMEERQRIKIGPDYVGQQEARDLEDRRSAQGANMAEIRLDTLHRRQGSCARSKASSAT